MALRLLVRRLSAVLEPRMQYHVRKSKIRHDQALKSLARIGPNVRVGEGTKLPEDFEIDHLSALPKYHVGQLTAPFHWKQINDESA